MMVEKSDEFDKWMLNRQAFPKKFSILHYTSTLRVTDLLT